VTTPPTPPPEAQLIRKRREEQVPRLSMREAARRAGISAPWWRMIETGIRRVKGQDFPETGNPETLARMARAVGATSAELAAAGRPDAAAILERLPDDPLAGLAESVQGASGLTDRQKQALLGLLHRR
jgi:transcriptional regulator with XRE-family HTH domain